MDGELLGRAVLELSTDQRPLDAGLASAERRVAISTAAMQATLERSGRQAGATLDKQLTPPIARVGQASDQMGRKVEGSLTGVASDAKKARTELDAVHSSLLSISRTMPPSAQLAALSAVRDRGPISVGRDHSAIVGARGIAAPGSRQNPIVVVLEAGKYTGLGALAAAIGQPDSSHQTPDKAPVIDIPAVEAKFSDTQYAGLLAAIQQSGGAGGGGRVPPVAVGGPGGGGGGGGPWFMPRAPGGDNSALRRLGWGGGIAGMAGIGSAASFAGLGFEHVLTALLGVAGSAAGAGIGAGALGLGSLGKLAVGGGSDLAVMASTLADTKALGKSYDTLQTAVETYGAKSKQAAAAQKALNVQMADLGGGAGVKAELQLAKNAEALNKFWDLQTSAARVAATSILEQVLTLGRDFVPMVAQAAQRNLTIINTGLRPLFAWLEGPQGIQIFNDLENRFAHDLPTAVHAFDQGIELLLRIVDIASAHTGGFIASIDHLLTRLNNVDNATLGHGIQHYIDLFRLWMGVVKLAGEDIFLLFHQDVGTGTSIVQMLDHMLGKLHDYETSSRGQAQLTNIFMVHKTEILELLQVFGTLAKTFGAIYMQMAPTLVSVMNDAVLPVLKALGGALAFIASHSSFAALLLGLTLISGKAFGISKTFQALRSLTQWMLGTGPAAKAGMALAASETAVAGGGAAGGAGAAGGLLARLSGGLKGGVEKGALGLAGGAEALGAGGLASGIAGAGGVIAAGAAAALPILLAGGAGILVARFFAGTFGLHVGTTTNVTPNRTTTSSSGGLLNTGVHVATTLLSPISLPIKLLGGPDLGKGVEKLLGIGTGSTLNVQTLGKFADYSTGALQKLIVQMKNADAVKLNGVAISKAQLLELAKAALKTKTDWNTSFNTVWSTINTFATGTGPVLAALKDRFATNMRLIAHELGINSDAGRKAVAHNIGMMVSDLRLNMAEGRISVHDGMIAIKQVLDKGMSDNAISWRQDWRDMFTTVTGLYKQHKIDTKTYLGDVRSITKTGWGHIRSEVQASLDRQKADLKAAHDDGKLTDAQYHTALHDAQKHANDTEKRDMADFASHVIQGMVASGASAAKASDVIGTTLNNALHALGAKPVSLTGIAVGAVASQIAGAVNSVAGSLFHAGGGLVQIGQPGQAGRDSVPLNVGGTPIMVAPGEQVAVFNRHQIPEANARFADWGGLSGYFANHTKPNYMAQGGIVPGFAAGAAAVNTATGAGGSNAYVSPFPQGTPINWGRQDAGVDMTVPPGTPVLAIGPGAITGIASNWYRGQPLIEQSLSSGPEAGKYLYYAEGLTSRVGSGQGVKAGQVIGVTTSQPTGLEFGWGGGGTSTLRSIVAGSGDSAGPWSSSYEAFIRSLVAGHTISVAGIPGGASVPAVVWNALKAPGVSGTGAMAAIVRAALAKETAAANAYGRKQAAAKNAASGAISAGAFAGQGGSNSANQALAHKMMLAAGWGESEWPSLLALWNQESGFSSTARNPSSGAAGIPQDITGNFHGGAAGQIAWGLNYIRGRYGSPSAAEAHERAFNWYARGGFVNALKMASGGNVWRVPFSQEDASSGTGWTELSTNGNAAAKSGHPHTASHTGGWDFATLGRAYPRGTMLNLRAPSGRSATAPETDVGDGSSFAPAIGLTPALRAALGVSSGTVDISMADGSNINLASGFGRLISGSGAGGSSTPTSPLTGSGLTFREPGVPAPSGPEHFLPRGIGTEHWGYRLTNYGRWLPASHKFPKAPAPLESLAGYGTKLGLLEADIAGKGNQFSSLSSRFGVTEQNPAFLNPDGSTNAAGIAQQIADTQALLALANGILADEHQELPLVKTALTRFLGAKSGTEGTITADSVKIAANKRKIAANKVKEGSIRTALLDLQKPTADQAGALERAIKAAKLKYDPAIKAAQEAKAKYRSHLGRKPSKAQREADRQARAQLDAAVAAAKDAEYGVVHPLEDSLIVAQSKQAIHKGQVRSESFRLRQQLNALTLDDKRLGAADSTLTGSIASLKQILTGAGGAEGENATISSLEQVAAKLGTVQWGLGGTFLGIDTANQGAAFDEQTTVDQLQNTLATLQAPPAPADTTTATSAADSQLASLLQQQLTQANQALAVSQAQYKVLANLPPYVGSYDKGGVIPGALGAPMLATVHGGEIISRPEQGSAADRLQVIVLDGAVDPNKIRVIANGEAVRVTRGQARGAGRPLPGGGGGLVRA